MPFLASRFFALLLCQRRNGTRRGSLKRRGRSGCDNPLKRMIGGSTKAVALAALALALAVPGAHGSVRSHARAGCTPRWHVVASANVPQLAAVAALSSTNVWAVGTKGRPDFPTSPIVAHWDGHKLDVVQAFRPSIPVGSLRGGKHPSGLLTGIAAVSSDDVWAVGTDGYGFFGKPGRPVAEHWNGRRWQRVRTPLLHTGAELSGVTALSQRDVWAVGQVGTRPLAEHWDGRQWKVIDMRREGRLNAVDGASPGNVWAVGAQGLTSTIDAQDGLVMHWDGRRWREVSAPARDDSAFGYDSADDFSAVDAVSRSEAWATHSGELRGDIQRWDGRRWRVVHVFPAKNLLGDFAALSSHDIWAVGVRFPGSFEPASLRPLVVHWDGRSWRVQNTSFERLRATLNGISALSPSDIWAVGNHLLARYACT
jgi:hypothetical protein